MVKEFALGVEHSGFRRHLCLTFLHQQMVGIAQSLAGISKIFQMLANLIDGEIAVWIHERKLDAFIVKILPNSAHRWCIAIGNRAIGGGENKNQEFGILSSFKGINGSPLQ